MRKTDRSTQAAPAVGPRFDGGVRALRSRVADLQVHCWPTDAAAARELMPPEPERFCSLLCPELCATPIAEVVRQHGGAKFWDLTGARYGSMTVVGLIEWRGSGASLWALRCDCGRYEPRKHRNIANGIKYGRQARCHICCTKLGLWDGETGQPFNGGRNQSPNVPLSGPHRLHGETEA